MGDSSIRKTAFTPIESAIMDAVWAGRKTTREIYDALPDEDRERATFTTISTYLMRMVQKGYLGRTPTSTREYEYSALVRREEKERRLVKELVDFSGINALKGVANQFLGEGRASQPIQEILRSLTERIDEGG